MTAEFINPYTADIVLQRFNETLENKYYAAVLNITEVNFTSHECRDICYNLLQVKLNPTFFWFMMVMLVFMVTLFCVTFYIKDVKSKIAFYKILSYIGFPVYIVFMLAIFL